MTYAQANVIIGLLMAGLGLPFLSWIRPIPRWEYVIENPGDSTFESRMDDLGSEGWELVSARRATSEFGPARYEMIFKRPKSLVFIR
jgi:hypothetical protein